MSQKYTIGIISKGDPFALKEWSGITSNMMQAFVKAGHTIVALGPCHLKIPFSVKCINIFYNFFRLGNYFPDQHPKYRLQLAAIFEARLSEKKIDLILAPSSATELSMIKTKIPVVYTADATFASMVDYYFDGLSKRSIDEGNRTSQDAMDRADMIIFPSDWAIKSAINDYKIPISKLVKIDFGANLQHEIPAVGAKELISEELKFVFLGVDWKRKGGQIVIETLQDLYKKGIRVSLTILGCEPDLPVLPFQVVIYPFLKKSNSDEYVLFTQIMFESHFLFLPTRKECYGIAFCEACAFGLPSITTNTGGVSSIIVHQENGLLLPLDAKVKDYVNQIEELLQKGQEEYLRISNNARKAYEERLNWRIFVEKFIEQYEQRITKK